MGLFALVVVAVMMMARFGRGSSGGREVNQPGASLRANERALDESSADTVVTNGNETVLTKLFPVGDDARVSFKNVGGSISVTAWDRPEVQVNVIRRGSSDRGTSVIYTSNGSALAFRTASNRGNSDVGFDVKVPRELVRVELSSTNGSLKVTDVVAEILVEGTNGTIELTRVSGVSRVNTTNGSIKAELVDASDRPMEFRSTNGAIELTVPSAFDADLDASTVRGSINIDPSFGVEIEKSVASQKAVGAIGLGGERLKITTTNGSIRLGIAEPRTKDSAKGRENGN
jgi:hypothetical protein